MPGTKLHKHVNNVVELVKMASDPKNHYLYGQHIPYDWFWRDFTYEKVKQLVHRVHMIEKYGRKNFDLLCKKIRT